MEKELNQFEIERIVKGDKTKAIVGWIAGITIFCMLGWTGFLYVVLLGGYGGYDLPDADERALRELLQTIPWTVGIGLTVFAVLSGLVVFVRHVVMRERPENSCEGCGYDLSGIQSSLCPECGSATADAPIAAPPRTSPDLTSRSEGQGGLA